MTVGSVVHAIAILRHLADQPQARGVNAIARALGISPSSCFNLLKTLAALSFLRFDPATKTYAIGDGLTRLAQHAGSTEAATVLLRPRLAAMAAEYRVASGLWRLLPSGRLVLVDFADSAHATRIHMTVGQRLPMFIGAMGRCVAARSPLPAAAIAEAVAALRWETPPTLARYRKGIAHARRHGWAIDDGDFMRGVTTIAAAITDAGGTVRFCIANTLFQGQHDAATMQRIGRETARIAAAAARTLYGAPAVPAGPAAAAMIDAAPATAPMIKAAPATAPMIKAAPATAPVIKAAPATARKARGSR